MNARRIRTALAILLGVLTLGALASDALAQAKEVGWSGSPRLRCDSTTG
jgi:hypothetical protein